MHLTITPKGITVDGTPLQVAEDTLHIHEPHPDKVAQVTLTLMPSTITITNTFEPHDISFMPKEEWDKAIKSVFGPRTRATLRAR